jgi:hypothetical protein
MDLETTKTTTVNNGIETTERTTRTLIFVPPLSNGESVSAFLDESFVDENNNVTNEVRTSYSSSSTPKPSSLSYERGKSSSSPFPILSLRSLEQLVITGEVPRKKMNLMAGFLVDGGMGYEARENLATYVEAFEDLEQSTTKREGSTSFRVVLMMCGGCYSSDSGHRKRVIIPLLSFPTAGPAPKPPQWDERISEKENLKSILEMYREVARNGGIESWFMSMMGAALKISREADVKKHWTVYKQTEEIIRAAEEVLFESNGLIRSGRSSHSEHAHAQAPLSITRRVQLGTDHAIDLAPTAIKAALEKGPKRYEQLESLLTKVRALSKAQLLDVIFDEGSEAVKSYARENERTWDTNVQEFDTVFVVVGHEARNSDKVTTLPLHCEAAKTSLTEASDWCEFFYGTGRI